MKEILVNSLEEISNAAKEFLEYISKERKDSRCVIFLAPMGTGKTTFIKALCKELKVKDEVSSPTFAIVNEYLRENGEKVYHFDLYRIKDTEEAMAAGAEEHLYSDSYCFIEWPETIMNILPENYIEVKIRETRDSKRIISIS